MPWSTSVTSGLVANRGGTPPLTSVWMSPASWMAALLLGAIWLGCLDVAGTRKYTFIDAQ